MSEPTRPHQQGRCDRADHSTGTDGGGKRSETSLTDAHQIQCYDNHKDSQPTA
jgi:hypothetical protein